MKKNFRILVAVLCVAGILAISGCGSSGGTAGKKWTFMVYMDGDNNLESFATDDFNEMKAVGSNDQVNIVVQQDMLATQGTKRYYVKKDSADLIEDMAEQNMADPTVLTAFINWAYTNYPAEKYVLVLWNHGGGFRKENPLKGIISDDTSGGVMMTVPQVAGAITASGKTFTIIGCDACLMAELEVAYEWRNYAQYLVASEEVEPGSGWPYTPILTALTANPNMTALQLCQQIVNDYIGPSARGIFARSGGLTLSATDLSKVAALCSAVNDFGQALSASTAGAEINTAKNNVQRYDYEFLADLYHFANLLSSSSDSNLAAKASAVKTALTPAVVTNGKSGSGVANSYGLTVYLPTEFYGYDTMYDDLAFTTAYPNWKAYINSGFTK